MNALAVIASCTLLVFLLPKSAGAETQLDDELSQAMALTADFSNGKVLYDKLCAECHGEDGWGSYGGEYP